MRFFLHYIKRQPSMIAFLAQDVQHRLMKESGGRIRSDKALFYAWKIMAMIDVNDPFAQEKINTLIKRCISKMK